MVNDGKTWNRKVMLVREITELLGHDPGSLAYAGLLGVGEKQLTELARGIRKLKEE